MRRVVQVSAVAVMVVLTAGIGDQLHRFLERGERAGEAARTVTKLHKQAYSTAGFRTVLDGFDPEDLVMRPYGWLRPDQIARIDGAYRERAVEAGYLAADGRDLGTVEQAYACQPILSFALKSRGRPGPDPLHVVDRLGESAYFGRRFRPEIEDFAGSAADPIRHPGGSDRARNPSRLDIRIVPDRAGASVCPGRAEAFRERHPCPPQERIYGSRSEGIAARPNQESGQEGPGTQVQVEGRGG